MKPPSVIVIFSFIISSSAFAQRAFSSESARLALAAQSTPVARTCDDPSVINQLFKENFLEPKERLLSDEIATREMSLGRDSSDTYSTWVAELKGSIEYNYDLSNNFRICTVNIFMKNEPVLSIPQIKNFHKYHVCQGFILYKTFVVNGVNRIESRCSEGVGIAGIDLYTVFGDWKKVDAWSICGRHNQSNVLNRPIFPDNMAACYTLNQKIVDTSERHRREADTKMEKDKARQDDEDLNRLNQLTK